MKRVKKINPKFILVIFVAILFLGCEEEPEINRSKLVKIYVETTIAQTKYSSFPDSLKLAKDHIFAKYNVTSEEYSETINKIEARVDYWNEFFKEAKTNLDSLKNSENQNAIPSLK